MSHADDLDPSQVPVELSISQLSADAACFVPSSFGQSVTSTSQNAASYLDGYVWQENELIEPSLYARTLGQWSLGHQNMPSSLEFNHYPTMEMDYWSVMLENPPAGQGSKVFYPSSSGISWDSVPPMQRTGIHSASSQQQCSGDTQDLVQHHSGIANTQTSNAPNGSQTVLADGGISIRAKKKKKKSRNLVKLDTNVPGICLSDDKVNIKHSTVEEKARSLETCSSRTTISNIQDRREEEPKRYKDNDAQTDFSPELSQLTLTEKPNTLYNKTARQDFFQKCIFSSSVAASTASSEAVPSKALLWTAVVSRKPSPSTANIKTSGPDSKGSVALNSSSKVDPVTPTGSSHLLGQLSKAGRDKEPLDYDKKSGFDHSSVRSQSGRRRSTGISTNDKIRDHKSSGKTTSGELLAENDESNAKKERGKRQTSASVTGRREYSADDKKRQTAKEASKLQKGSMATGDESAESKIKRQKFVNRAEVFTGAKKDGLASSSGKQNASMHSKSAVSKLPMQRTHSASASKNTIMGRTSMSRSFSRGQREVENKLPLQVVKTTQSEVAVSLKSAKFSWNNKNSFDGDDADILPAKGSKAEGNKNEKRRNRNRKKKSAGKEGGEGRKDKIPPNSANLVSDSVRLAAERNTFLLPFDDSEFPLLLSAAEDSMKNISSGPIKYSDILSGRARTPSFPGHGNHQNSKQKEDLAQQDIKNKTKGREDVSDLSNSDLDDVCSLEKGVLKKGQLKVNARSLSQPAKPLSKQLEEKKVVGAGVKTKEPITLSIFDMITVKAKNKKQAGKETDRKQAKTGTKESKSGNILDSSAVNIRRGKEREVPKPKKPSLLRKVILKERESRRTKFLQDCMKEACGESDAALAEGTGEDGSVERLRRHASAPMHASTSRVASVSPCDYGIRCPQTNVSNPETPDPQKEMVQSLIHSRRFREYCTQVLNPEIDSCCTTLLHELVRFQDRLYHKDPNKAKLKRRIVLGLREVTKHLKVFRIKCVIISPNLERIQSKGGLDEALYNIIGLCQEQNVPFVFALSRKQLGRACCKVVPVSVVGIFSYDGAEEHFRRLKDLTEKAHESYQAMVSSLKVELDEVNRSLQDDSVNENGENSHVDGKTGDLRIPPTMMVLCHGSSTTELSSRCVDRIADEEESTVCVEAMHSEFDGTSPASTSNSCLPGASENHVPQTTVSTDALEEVSAGVDYDGDDDSMPVSEIQLILSSTEIV